jgi:hypothetical protein
MVESPNQVSSMHIPPECADLALAKEGDSTTTPSMGGLCDKSPGRRSTSQESRVPPVTGDGSYGNICHRVSGTGIHSAFHFTCLLKFLFCEEEGWRFMPVH